MNTIFPFRGFPLLLLTVIGLLGYSALYPMEKPVDPPDQSKVPQELPEIKRVEKTRSIIGKEGEEIAYKLIFDCMPVKTDSLPTYSGRMCYNAYLVEGDPTRPISFFFNGGPGAASVFLNFGVAGPQIIRPQIDENNFILPDGADLVDNPLTWLDHSDLVFIDPVGTGFSYVVTEDKKETDKILKNFWGVKEDLQSLSHFIRLWITDNNRWMSPKVIVGESYGGLRAGAMANYLLEKTGLSPAGVVMVSPALDLWLIREQSRISLSPWLRFLPSFIHTARHHGRGGDLPGTGDIEERIESYLLQKYLPRIASGNILSEQESKIFYQELSGLIGLNPELITKKWGQVDLLDFSKNLLSDRGMVISLYDGTVAYLDPHPGVWYYRGDTYLGTVSAAFHRIANHYYRNELGVNGLREFHSLNSTANASWKYPGGDTSVETFSDLEEGLSANPRMEVLIVHGRHDLVTPYYTSRYLITHSRIPEVQKKIRLLLYDGGHMFYLNQESLKAFDKDMGDFYERLKGK